MPAGESAFFEDPDYQQRRWEAFGDPSGKATKVGIKRPDMLCRSDQISRVSQHLPDARFVVVLRDPIRRAVSAYYHLVRHAHLRPAPLDRGLELALEAYRTTSNHSPIRSIVDYGRYGHYLTEWYQRYEPSRFLVLAQSGVAAAPASAVAQCERHIGVPAEVVDVERDRENVGVYDDRVLWLAQTGHRLRTTRLPEASRRVPSKSRALRLVGAGLSRAADRLARPGARPPALPARIEAALREIYEEDLAVLRPLVGIEAVDWTFGDGGSS